MKNNYLSVLFLLIFLSGFIKGSAGEIMGGRRNIADAVYGSFAEVSHADGKITDGKSAISGRHDDSAAVQLRGEPSVFTVNFPGATQINAVRIYPGNITYASMASGECSFTDYRLERFNNGYWHLVKEVKNAPSYAASKASSAEEYFFEHHFKPINASAMRIILTRSGDTGKRMGGKTVSGIGRNSFLRSFEVYEARKSGHRITRISAVLEGDFRLPVYRNQVSARLVLTLQPFFKPFDAELLVREEKTGKVYESRKLRIEYGATELNFKLSKYPHGRYFVDLFPRNGKECGISGHLIRLLRVDRGGRVELPSEPIDVREMRIFPVDDFHFVERKGISLEMIPAQAVQVTHNKGCKRFYQYARSGNWLDCDKDGNWVMMYTDYDLEKKNPKIRYAVSRDLRNWKECSRTPSGQPNRQVESPWDPIPAPAVPHWGQKTPFSKAEIRFWTKEDGMPPLNEIRVICVMPSYGNAAAKGLVRWGNYPVWEKKKGEWIVLLKKPLMVCKFGFEPEELETEQDSNDNFCTQFVSDDGRMLVFAQGAKLRRFPPYTVEYDNIRQGARILRSFYTSDGFTWKHFFTTLPDETDHWSFQHYGMQGYRVSKNFYLAYLHAYHCTKQQIYPEVIYSRDGLNWNRIPGHKAFIPNTAKGTWLFGMNFMEAQPPPYEYDGKYLIPIGTSWKSQHFYPLNLLSKPNRLTTDFLRNTLEGRNFKEQWPYFKEIGGWEGLKKEIEDSGNSVGFAVMRKDGWIAAIGRDARLVSRVFHAPGCYMKLNGSGFFEVELLDPDGVKLPAYSGKHAACFKGDDIGRKLVFGKNAFMPKKPFRVRIRMKNSQLYTLLFTNYK